jgi:hypothetical protein
MMNVLILNQLQKVIWKIKFRLFLVYFFLDFFAREGERFIREDPLLPFSNSILTDITQNQDQSWSNEQPTGSPGCSTTTFFMAKSSTPDEMLNALLAGKLIS